MSAQKTIEKTKNESGKVKTAKSPSILKKNN